ncbi:MAG: transglutaminase domain-containing protein, partial [Candidatus Aminicenantes bacterium]|nr:transglutaminase domain-containing protein [Candidatus Aminicenantes bacterium]
IASGFSLHRDRSGNDFVNAELSGSQGQEAVIVWSAVVLVAGRSLIANRTRPESYRAASACVQSGAAPVRELAARLWPAGGGLERYAGNIQRFIQGMEQRERTWSLDALGILKSGQGGICTANANLACALLRAQGIPCRSLAVIPPISRRLEMHRIVECFASGGWIRFDPSLLHVEIPLKPWQGIIMAKSGIADEEASMRPRIGAMPGCPFGQEAEIAQPGLSLHGSDFFWTVAVPLACFSVSGEAFDLAMKGWEGFVGSGVCAQAQIHAAGASDLAQFVAAMKGE